VQQRQQHSRIHEALFNKVREWNKMVEKNNINEFGMSSRKAKKRKEKK